jgi:hypothetical protein
LLLPLKKQRQKRIKIRKARGIKIRKARGGRNKKNKGCRLPSYFSLAPMACSPPLLVASQRQE